MTVKIRKRERRGRPRETHGAYTAWTEWQVVDGTKVAYRADTRAQAVTFAQTIDPTFIDDLTQGETK